VQGKLDSGSLSSRLRYPVTTCLMILAACYFNVSPGNMALLDASMNTGDDVEPSDQLKP
jgi:hypothetical protein